MPFCNKIGTLSNQKYIRIVPFFLLADLEIKASRFYLFSQLSTCSREITQVREIMSDSTNRRILKENSRDLIG